MVLLSGKAALSKIAFHKKHFIKNLIFQIVWRNCNRSGDPVRYTA
jgi:hypothetical protein